MTSLGEELDYLKIMGDDLQKIQSKMDEPTDLEDFLSLLGGNYHSNGHHAVASMYWKIFTTY